MPLVVPVSLPWAESDTSEFPYSRNSSASATVLASEGLHTGKETNIYSKKIINE